jgi:hypothetical protein
MLMNFICQIDRLNSNIKGQRNYIASAISFDCLSSDRVEQEFGRELAQSRQHFTFIEFPESLSSIRRQMESVTELTKQSLFDEQAGGMQLWLPDGPLGSFYISALSGSDGLGDIASLADMALQNQHLYIQFSINVGFSMVDNNPHLPRPVTIDMFREGVCMYVPNLPEVGLVRRHIP